jgi:hypothetical protein
MPSSAAVGRVDPPLVLGGNRRRERRIRDLLEPKGETVRGEAVLVLIDVFIDEFVEWQELTDWQALIDRALIDSE